MSSRRQTLLARVNWYLQSSSKHITELITGNKFYYTGGRYRQVSLYDLSGIWTWVINCTPQLIVRCDYSPTPIIQWENNHSICNTDGFTWHLPKLVLTYIWWYFLIMLLVFSTSTTHSERNSQPICHFWQITHVFRCDKHIYNVRGTSFWTPGQMSHLYLNEQARESLRWKGGSTVAWGVDKVISSYPQNTMPECTSILYMMYLVF